MAHTYFLSGSFDAEAATAKRAELEALSASDTEVRLDLSEVDFLDSSGVGAIVFLYKRLSARKIGLTLVGAEGQPARLLEFLRVPRVIPMVATDLQRHA